MIGTVVSGYKILEKIGAGGMGDVYKARDSKLERDVAIKVLRSKLGADPSLLATRFDTEATVLAKLNHPNIVTFYKEFREGNQFYLAFEFIQGETLDKLSKRCGAIPWQTAVPLICQALNGLEYAHNLKVMHRDIRPANLMLTQAGILKIMDFGITSILGGSYVTWVRHLVDTRRYRSPEQLKGQKTDTRSDLYAIGAVLYQLLTGHVPFDMPVTENPVSPRVFVPEIPQVLEAAVMRALARAPEERFQSAAAFRTELETISKTAAAGRKLGKGPTSRPETTPGGAPTPSVQAVPVAAAPAATEPPAQRHLASYWSYLKRYRTAIVSCILIGIAALLIRIAYKPPPPIVVTQPDQIQQADKGQEQRPESSSVKPTVEQPPAAAPAVVEPQSVEKPLPVVVEPPSIAEQSRVVEPPPAPVPVTPVPSLPEQPPPVANVVPPPAVPAKPQPEKKPAVRAKAPAPVVPAKPQPEKKPVVQPKAPAPTVSAKPQTQEKKKRHTGSSSRGAGGGGWKITD